MRHDDPRHGTVAGHMAHVKSGVPQCLDCKRAKLRYDKRRRVDEQEGRERLVPMWRVRRRVEALQALGHSLAVINRAGGLPPRKLHCVMFKGEAVRVATFEGVDKAFRVLSMTPGADKRVSNNARGKGYLPPLAWDDVDDPTEQPTTGSTHRPKTDVDPVVVQRVLAGDRLRMTTAERREVVRTALERGWSWREIEERTGVSKVERYVERGAA